VVYISCIDLWWGMNSRLPDLNPIVITAYNAAVSPPATLEGAGQKTDSFSTESVGHSNIRDHL